MNTRISSGLGLRTGSGLLCPVMLVLIAAAVPVYGHVASSSVMAFSANDDDPKPSGAKAGDPPKPRAGKKGRGGRRGRSPRTRIDPEMEERVRELLDADPAARAEKAGELLEARHNLPGDGDPERPRRPRRSGSRRSSKAQRTPPGGEEGGSEDAPEATAENAGPTTTMDIPPSDSTVPPEERVYSFSIKNGTYEQLIETVARMTGLGVIGEAPKGGKVSFVADQELTFDELLGRVSMLLFKYKPHEPYFLSREETHLEVIRVTDMYRIMPRDRMFGTVELFRAAELPDHQLALVKYTPTSGSVAQLSIVRDFMPDYVRVTPMEDENTVIIFGLVSDIEKYLWLKDFFVSDGGNDPRILDKIPVEYLTPTEAVEQLGQLMDLGGGGSGIRRKTGQKGRTRTASPLQNIPEPEVSILPSDAQGVIIVRAMKDKIEEMRFLLQWVDVETEVTHEPVVIKVEHTDPVELIATIQQVLSASVSSATSPRPSSKKKGLRSRGKSTSRGVSPVTTDDITLMAHPTQSAILVMADDEGVARIREYVEMFDVPWGVERVPIDLEHVTANQIISVIQDLLSASPSTGGTAAVEPQLIPDLSGSVIWFTGTEQDLATVREMVQLMDNAEDVPTLHIVRLVNQSPSFVAGLLEDYIAEVGSGGGAAPKTGRKPARKPKKSKRRGKSAARTSRAVGAAGRSARITPNDEQGQLFILCTDEEWEEYLPIIEMLENEAPRPELVRIEVEHIAPQDAITKINALLGGAPKSRKTEGMRLEATDGAILVMGASQREIETIRELLTQFDHEVDIEQRTFVIKHGDPSEIATAVRMLVEGSSGGATPKARRRGKAAGKGARPTASSGARSADLTIVELGDRLVVQAPPEIMEQVAAFIEEFDVEERATEVRVYEDFSPGTDIEEISAKLSSRFGGGKRLAAGARKKGEARGAGSSGPEFIPQPGAGRLVVIAESTMFAKIEELLDVLRVQVDVPLYERVFIDVQHADPAELVEQIDPLLAQAVEQLIRTGRLSGATQGVALSARAPKKPGKRGASKTAGRTTHQRYLLNADVPNRRIVISAPAIVIEEARKLCAEFDLLRPIDDIVVTVVEVEHGDPELLVETITPLLALRVQQLIRSGELSGSGVGAVSPAPRPATRKKSNIKPRQQAADYHLTPDLVNRRIVIAGPKVIADEAARLIAEFDRPIDTDEPVAVVFVDVLQGDPEVIVEAITPLLDLRIGDMVARGDLPDAGRARPAPVGKARKPGASRARSSDKRYHLEPDVANRRIVIAAARIIIDEATGLIEQFDRPPDVDTEFRTIDLQNASPEEMVQAVKELMGKPSRAPRGKGKGKPGGGTPSLAGEGLKIVESPGGGAIVLSGPRADVEQAAAWIEQLDMKSVTGRIIKVYEIENADVSRLVDLIMADIETAPPPGKKGRRKTPARRGLPVPEEEEEDEEFQVFKTRQGPDVYLQANLIESTLVVSATRPKIARIDEIVAQVDDSEDLVPWKKEVIPKRAYELKYADGFDAALDLEAILEVLWEPSDELPKVDYTTVGGVNVLIVKYPHEDRFPEIRELIAKYADTEPEGGGIRRKVLPPPANVSPMAMALWFQQHHPDLDIEIIDVTPKEMKTYGTEQLGPWEPVGESPCVLPTAFARMTGALLADAATQVVVGQDVEGEDEDAPEDDVDPEGEEAAEDETAAEGIGEEQPPGTSDQLLRDAGRSLESQAPVPGAEATDKEAPPKRPGPATANKVKLIVNSEDGTVIIVGTPGAVEDVTDSIDELKEESEKLPTPPPDIRIYRVKFIDVFSAANIINEMFNATRQQRQQVQRQQQLQRQRQTRQQRQQRGQQQKGQQGQQQGRPGQRGRQQQQRGLAQLPPTAVRVYPNPRDRSLILRAEVNQYPALLKLLATIDQPKPIDSTHRIYPLKKLNAVEVEEILKDWLGLTEVKSSRPRTQTSRRGGRRGGTTAPVITEAAGQLPETVMQPTKTGSELGVDPKDIKLSSNEESNTILVMAPKAALDYIGKLIDELESQDIPERIWKDYYLQFADVEQLSDYLTSRYEGDTAKPQRRTPKGGKGKRDTRAGRGPTSSKPAFNTPTFTSYPRLKLLSVQAVEDVHTEIEELIKELDVSPEDEQYESVRLRYADAEVVADMLSAMFGAQGTGSKSGKRGRSQKAAAAGDFGPKFIGEAGSTILYYRAPVRLHERILTVIDELEEQLVYQSKPRLIKLQHAKASDVADAIEGAYGGRSSGKRSGKKRGGRSGGSTGGTARFTVTGDDTTKLLFVTANDELFADIESLARSLDVPRTLDFEFRIYPLKYANAKATFTKMDKLIADYIRRLGRNEPMEPFSVEVDEESNSLIVLGTPVVFGFVEQALVSIDTPANAASPPAVLMIPLKNADAQEVAQNIKLLWAGRRDRQSTTEPPVAEANRALNLLIVRGTQKQIDEIKETFLDPLEQQTAHALTTETLQIEHMRAEDVAETITKFFEEKQAAAEKMGREGRKPPAHELTVVITPDVHTNQLIVQASEDNMAMIKERISAIDTERVASETKPVTKIYPIRNADPKVVETIIKEWAQPKGQAGGRGRSAATVSLRDRVIVVAEPMTGTVVVTASPSNHELIALILAGLENEDNIPQRKPHVIQIENANAAAVATTLTEIFVKSAPRQQRGGVVPITISALQGSNSIVVKCDDEDFEEIQAAIVELDLDPGAGEEVRVVTLLYADATEMQTAVQEYLRKPGSTGGRRGGADLVGDVRISVLAQGNSLVVSGDLERVEGIVSVIGELDLAGEKGSIPHIISLQYAKVNQILPSLQSMFTEMRGGRGKGQIEPVIVTNDILNVLIVRASPTDVTAIESVVAKLDVPEVENIADYKLIKVAATLNVIDLADTVQESVNEGARMRMRGARDQLVPAITVIPDKRLHAVVLAGSASLFEPAEKLIRAMEETSGTAGISTRIIKLHTRKAEDILRVIDRLKGESSGSGRSRRSGSGSSRSRSGGGSRGSTGKSRPRSSRPRGR